MLSEKENSILDKAEDAILKRFSDCLGAEEPMSSADFESLMDGVTSTGKMEQSRVLQGQADYLDQHQELGARCYVIIGFSSGAVYRFPWNIWQNMKKHFGRKYVTEADVEIAAYLVPVTRDGVLLLLD